MGICILFRQYQNENPFRDHLFELAEHFPGDELIISTGYIQESIFFDSSDPQPNGRNYIDDFAIAINDGLPPGGKLSIIGGRFWQHEDTCLSKNGHTFVQGLNYIKDSKCHLCNFYHFKDYIENNTNIHTKPINVQFYHDSNWHAKVAVKLLDGEFVGGIIGSSNLTDPSFSSYHKYPNKECDVFFWNRKLLSKGNIECSIDSMTWEQIKNFDGIHSITRIPVQITTKGLSERDIYKNIITSVKKYRL
ncbi:hypothetical protein GCM10011351_28490 [Paraliobacillus quinghaiensis]|uniref:Phospholipase D-like domain-containing protein n=1 Tax=Paraliobacillus quinghaiensis TaxID=470815 RepID=A0A917WYG8_9BACI|nr:hypothetical protein [Paraliobacillus quinghaiensis]GGM40590.1 hypothetical protein GCM10011351_28490 [Paraliobacillus quinghaiensis]